jgi:hypothetical protein
MGMGRMLIIAGLFLLAVGVVWTLADKLPIRLGKLPGDIEIRGKNSVFYFPLMTCLLLSVVFSVLMWVFGRK